MASHPERPANAGCQQPVLIVVAGPNGAGAARRALNASDKGKQLRREVQAGIADLDAGNVVGGTEAFGILDRELGD